MHCFFFSSRRRHTRWPRDWSSDVCSSDLATVFVETITNDPIFVAIMPAGAAHIVIPAALPRDAKAAVFIRSEEHTSELQSRGHLVCRLLLEKKNRNRLTWFILSKRGQTASI